MESKSSTHTASFPLTTSHSSSSDTKITTTPNSFVLSPIRNTTVTTPTSQSAQAVPAAQSTIIDSHKNNNTTKKKSDRLPGQPTFPVKEEQLDDTPLRGDYPLSRTLLTASAPQRNNPFPPTTVNSISFNPREIIHGLPTLPMSMTNIGSHLMSALNQPHLTENGGAYFLSGLPSDLATDYKPPRSSNTDLPSPSNSSNSSNPSSANHHQGKRHGEGGDPNRKRAVRLQKNRDAARECRRKKKEYIKCLEERVTGLETQNKALIEELRQLKELYCRREDNTNNTNNKTTAGTR